LHKSPADGNSTATADYLSIRMHPSFGERVHESKVRTEITAEYKKKEPVPKNRLLFFGQWRPPKRTTAYQPEPGP
jgi:hypothetical protein